MDTINKVQEVGKSSKHMTEFGRTLYSLMLTRGIEHRIGLLKPLNDGGYTISQSRLTYYFNGDRVVDPMFFLCVCELLNLGKREREQLSYAYANGQLKPSSEQSEVIEGFRAKS